MRKSTRQGQGGVTLTELLAVLAILGLLATLSVPVVINRAQQAKFSVAKAECEALAKGEDMCGLMHGYYVPLQMLDDIPYDPGAPRDPLRTDDIRNEKSGSAPYVIDVSISPYTQYTAGNQRNLTDTFPLRLVRLETDWSGPFTQSQRVFHSSVGYPSSTYERRDFPLDPWGNPYRLYSPLGITGSDAGTQGNPAMPLSVIDSDSFSNGRLSTTDKRWDRFAVVSFGPDSVSDGPSPSPTKQQDDIVYFFGALIPESTFYIP